MKKFVKSMVFMFVFALMLIPTAIVKAEGITTEEALREALKAGGEITLGGAITVTSPLYVSVDGTTINGGKLQADPSFARDGSNGSLITVTAGVTATFTDIEIVNDAAQSKYGLQAFNTGVAILNGVNIHDSKWGAILVNGGGICVIDLTLNDNGPVDNRWGIEFGQAADVGENNPAIMMYGKISGNQEKLLYFAENDNLSLVEFANLEDSEMTLAMDGKTLVLKNSDGTVFAKSNEIKDGATIEEVKLDDEEETPITKTEKKEENPNTSDNIIAVIALAFIGLIGAFVTTKRLARR